MVEIHTSPEDDRRWGDFTVIVDDQVPADEVWITTPGGGVRYRLRSDAVVLKDDGSFTVNIPDDLAGYAGLERVLMPLMRSEDYSLGEPTDVPLLCPEHPDEELPSVKLPETFRALLRRETLPCSCAVPRERHTLKVIEEDRTVRIYTLGAAEAHRVLAELTRAMNHPAEQNGEPVEFRDAWHIPHKIRDPWSLHTVGIW